MENPTRTPEEQAKNSSWFARHKVLTGFIGVIVFFGVIGSLGDSKSTNNTSSSSSSEKASGKPADAKQEAKSYGIKEDVRVGDVRWKVTEVKDRGNTLKGSESKYPSFTKNKATSGKFVQITVEVEKLGSEIKSASNLNIVDEKGREFIHATDVSSWLPEGKEMFLLSNLNPNVPQTFTDIYEIPADAVGLKLKVGDLELLKNNSALINLGL